MFSRREPKRSCIEAGFPFSTTNVQAETPRSPREIAVLPSEIIAFLKLLACWVAPLSSPIPILNPPAIRFPLRVSPRNFAAASKAAIRSCPAEACVLASIDLTVSPVARSSSISMMPPANAGVATVNEGPSATKPGRILGTSLRLVSFTRYPRSLPSTTPRLRLEITEETGERSPVSSIRACPESVEGSVSRGSAEDVTVVCQRPVSEK